MSCERKEKNKFFVFFFSLLDQSCVDVVDLSYDRFFVLMIKLEIEIRAFSKYRL